MSVSPPVPISARIDALDVVRGLALFGVLAINLVNEFRVSIFAQFLPPPGFIPPVDRGVAWFLSTFIEFKALALFSLLFGMGLAIQFEHLAARPDRLVLLIRRLLALLAFGLVHLLLIWNGDILTEYAIAGFVVLPFLFVGRFVLALAAGAALALYLAIPWLPLPFGMPTTQWLSAHVAAAHEVYGQGSYAAIQAFRVAEIPRIAVLHAYVFPRTVALMLLGAFVWRSGVIARAETQRGLFWGTAAVALLLGVILSVLADGVVAPLGRGVWVAEALARVTLAIGYAALVVWIVTGRRWRWLLAWAAPVGRMAFTNYVMQSVVLGLLFYGYGLGLMGRLGVAAGFGIAVAIYVAQVLVSEHWLRNHQFGPLEWLWRTLTYGRHQPWRRGPDEAPPIVRPTGG